MESMKYGVEFIYEKYGKLAIEKEILMEQAEHWKSCYEELQKGMEELQKAYEEEKNGRETWYNFWLEKCGEVRDMRETVNGLEEELAKKDEIIAGFGNEVGKMLLSDEHLANACEPISFTLFAITIDSSLLQL